MIGTRQFEAAAGPCTTGGTHKWYSVEILVFKGATSRRYETACRRCDRMRVREYTQRGNHIAGYRTEGQ